MKKWVFLLFLFIPFNVNGLTASDITNNCEITHNGNKIDSKIIDKDYKTSTMINRNDLINVTCDDIEGIYIVYYSKSETGIINNNKHNIQIGNNGFVHEYLELDKTNNFTLKYDNDVTISDIYIFNSGETPEFVQKWNDPYEEADLLLFSTHGDDEQLFFLGLIPTYIDKKIRVQVSYLAHHNDNPRRIHEQLNGLWEVGLKNYPVFGVIPDAYSESLEGAISNLKNAGLDEEYVIKHQTELIRRFKPLVVVGHDELGEYSHGQHILNTYALKLAIDRSNDPLYYSDITYKPWEVKKTYLHLYKDNKITLNYDVPLKSYDGATAYEVSKRGYKMHESQQWTWFTKWINGQNNNFTKAVEITKYSPCEFGLYKTTVGDDINKNDMFENIILREKNNKKDIIKKVKKQVNKIRQTNNKDYLIYMSTAGILVIIILISVISKRKK